MNSPSNELQRALYAHLASQPSLNGVPIIDSATLPDLPAIRFGRFTEVADDLTMQRHHVRVAFDFHIFIREPGSSSTKITMAKINTAIRGWTPDLDGMACVDLRYNRQQTMRDADDASICHGVISFNALIEHELVEVSA